MPESDPEYGGNNSIIIVSGGEGDYQRDYLIVRDYSWALAYAKGLFAGGLEWVTVSRYQIPYETPNSGIKDELRETLLSLER